MQTFNLEKRKIQNNIKKAIKTQDSELLLVNIYLFLVADKKSCEKYLKNKFNIDEAKKLYFSAVLFGSQNNSLKNTSKIFKKIYKEAESYGATLSEIRMSLDELLNK